MLVSRLMAVASRMPLPNENGELGVREYAFSRKAKSEERGTGAWDGGAMVVMLNLGLLGQRGRMSS
jgi:hypothetical protein